MQELLKRLKGQGHGSVLVRGAGGAFIVTIFGTGLVFLVNVLLARLLGVLDYGMYIYALTWINLLALLSRLGIPAILVRFVSAYVANNKWPKFLGIIKFANSIVTVTSIVIALSIAIVVKILESSIGIEQARIFWVALFLLPITGLAHVRAAVLRGLKLVLKSKVPEGVIRPLLILMAIGFFGVLLDFKLTAAQAMLINVCAALAAFLVGAFWLNNSVQSLVSSPVVPKFAQVEWIRVAVPLMFIEGMHLVLAQTDILMVGALLGPEYAGTYAVAARLAGLVIFGLTAVNTIAAPQISELHSTKNHRQLQRITLLAAYGIFALTFGSGLVLLLGGSYVLSIFGDEFVGATVALQILVIGQIINALTGPVGFLMTMTGHQNAASVIAGLSALFNIVGNAILIPMYGIEGAAVATGVTIAVKNVVMLIYVLRRVGVNPTIFQLSFIKNQT